MTRLSLVLASAVLAAACGGAAPNPLPAAPDSAHASRATPAPGGSQLMAGLGDHHHSIHTSNPEAQKFFDQGMALAFGFNHEAAIRSFDRSAELDPKAAMPHWGRAWALGPNYNMEVDDEREKQAHDAMTQAKMLAADASPAERDYLEAMDLRY